MRSESLVLIILVRSWVSFSLLCRRRGMKMCYYFALSSIGVDQAQGRMLCIKKIGLLCL